MPEGKFEEPTKEDLMLYFDSAWTHYIASVKPPRPGFGIFSTILEHQFFPPGTPKNDDFKILATGWHHKTLWMTVSIPTVEKHLAEAVARYCDLKILDTFPISNKEFPMFATIRMESYEELKASDPNIDAFPLHNGINIFSLENSKDHPTRNGKMPLEQWMRIETETIRKIVGDHEWTDKDEDELKKFKEYMDI